MAVVTGYTSEKMNQINNDTVITGTVNPEGELILKTRGGESINAGRVGEGAGPPPWLKDSITVATDINTLVTSGFVGILPSDSPNLPVVNQGVLEVFVYGSALTQRFTTYLDRSRTYIRHRSGSGTWGAWTEPAWVPKSLPIDTDLNTVTAPGNYDFSHATYINGPVTPLNASVEVLQIHRAVIQRFTTWETVPRTFVRRSLVDNLSWGAWTQMPGPAELAALTWLHPEVPASDANANLNNYNENGIRVIRNPNALNTPILGKQGYVDTVRIGSSAIQTFTTFDVVPRVFRRYRGSDITVWGIWSESAGDSAAVPAGTDFNNLYSPMTYAITNGNHPNMPEATIGVLESLKVARATIQRYTTWSPIKVYIRQSDLDNKTWQPWQLQPKLSDITGLDTRVLALESKTEAKTTSVSGYKSAYLALNQPAGASTETVNSGSVRWPVTIGVTAQRARIHIRNWAWAYGTAEAPYTYKGVVDFTGVWVGEGNGKTFVKEPTMVALPFATNAEGDEYVSSWFAYEFKEDVQHLVSLGFNNAVDQVNYSGRGGCWRNTNANDGGSLDPAMESSVTSPFDVWIELEIPRTTPILAGFGDSNTVGTGSTLPIHDSWLSQYCRKNRAIPMHIANHGSAYQSWTDGNSPRWTRFGNVAPADALVYFLHQNDLLEGITTDTLKQYFRDILTIVKNKITPNVYAATITPGNKTSGVDTVRKEYNTWLKGRPEGVLDCFDFSAAVSDDDTVIRPGDGFDTIHFNTLGHSKIAAELQKRPVTPRVLTRMEIERLLIN